MSWHYTMEKIAARIAEVGRARVRLREPLPPLEIDGRERRRGGTRRDEADPRHLGAGETYDAAEESVILRCRIRIPDDWEGARVLIALEFGGAETLVSIDGTAAQAIDHKHHSLLLADPAQGGRTYDLALDAYTGTPDAQRRGGWSGAGEAQTTESTVQVELRTAELQAIDAQVEALYFDMRVAFEATQTMDLNSLARVAMIDALDAATNLLDFSHGRNSDSLRASAPAARAYLQENLYEKLRSDGSFTPTLWATGHAHIDTAWLWRIAHTRKKIGRTFTTALALMDEFPQYHFSASQAQQYVYLKEDHPDIYARVKDAVGRGRWEPVGGMWVESDCNVVSGESLVRQFLYGRAFFEREFGYSSSVVWLPDVFGYSAAFPQIIRKSGMKYFMTIKIFWSQINKPPYQTFEWEGIDGSRILTHFSPLGDYNAVMSPEQWQRTWNNYDQKHISSSALYIYGYGDGGGGPTSEMLEMSARAQDLAGIPRVKLATNQAFFEDLERQAAGNALLPRWVGELYLEYHRGTYTSQARNKKSNRRSEFLLQSAEQLSCAAAALCGSTYPHSELAKAWELTLLNQFHDIIPGSSIHAVYEDSARDYEAVEAAVTEAANTALAAIAARAGCAGGDVLIYNPLSWDRTGVAALPRRLGLAGQHAQDMDGNDITLVSLCDIASLGYTVIGDAGKGRAPNAHDDGALSGESELRVAPASMENSFFRIALDDAGEIVSIFDKRFGREVIDAGAYCKANALLLFEDKPLEYDAWDIDIFYQDKITPVRSVESIEVIETGPLRATLQIRRRFGAASHCVQRISIYRDIAQIDFDTEVDWQERSMLLKVAFPVMAHAHFATYDIAFGNVARPTHWNTTWDWARFEVCAHKWADLSEGAGYGVSLLSECKYGWDIRANVMRLTLVKGAEYPDPDADRGRQRFAYALYPHGGDWRAAETVRRAYEFNVPVIAARSPAPAGPPESPATAGASFSLVSPGAPNLIVETVKMAEDGSGALVVRLYECYGQRGEGSLSFGVKMKGASLVNLMEVETDETRAETIGVEASRITFGYTPYEIKTFKIAL